VSYLKTYSVYYRIAAKTEILRNEGSFVATAWDGCEAREQVIDRILMIEDINSSDIKIIDTLFEYEEYIEDIPLDNY